MYQWVRGIAGVDGCGFAVNVLWVLLVQWLAMGGLDGCGVGYGGFLLGVWLTVGRGGLRWVYGVVCGGSGWFLIHPVVFGGGL
uniref:Transmembrane protein n=1 Tax=Fagus sylvatica TaxID=28930 RepID=A0A2N9HLA0_FAGSY